MNAQQLSQVMGRKVTGVQCCELCSLWAGYGSVKALSLSLQPQEGEPSKLQLVCKVVDPPQGSGVSHERKLRSYVVESEFYRSLSEPLRAAGVAVAEIFHLEATPTGKAVLLMTDLRLKYPVTCGMLSGGQLDAALDWLAAFHAFSWQQPQRWGNLWPEGCYWRLDTRQEELQQIPSEWQRLKNASQAIAELLREGTHGPLYRTVVHGDFKAPNLQFSNGASGVRCAAVDFQYCGGGYGARDLAKLMVSALDMGRMGRADSGDAYLAVERQILQAYHSKLLARLAGGADGTGTSTSMGTSTGASTYSLAQLQQHYELCLLDYVRFLQGWGLWGNTDYAEARCLQLLDAVDGGRCLSAEEYRVALRARYAHPD
ncbi:kinase-like domain-containing protein, partial [Ochromonadaceae sp. CCMP2298]